MDSAEQAALEQLGRREEWPAHDLPNGVDTDMLRCLDQLGLVEARSVHLVNRQKFHGDPTPPAPSLGRWFSPLKSPHEARGWDRICNAPPLGTHQPERSRVDTVEVPVNNLGGFFPRTTRRITSLWVAPKVPSFYVRVSELGLAELARQRRKPVTSGQRKPAGSAKARPRLGKLQKHDMQAWQLCQILGLTQKEVAEQLNAQHGTTYGQPHVSKMIRRAMAHAEASGLSNKLPKKAERERAIDPTRLDLGARTDKRRPKPSNLPDD